MLHSVSLRDYMLPHPVKVKADANMLEAMQIIIDNKISGLCVVDDTNNLVGILSELDCLRAVLSATYNKTSVGPVREHMASDNLVVAHPDEDIVDIAQDNFAFQRVETRAQKIGIVATHAKCESGNKF